MNHSTHTSCKKVLAASLIALLFIFNFSLATHFVFASEPDPNADYGGAPSADDYDVPNNPNADSSVNGGFGNSPDNPTDTGSNTTNNSTNSTNNDTSTNGGFGDQPDDTLNPKDDTLNGKTNTNGSNNSNPISKLCNPLKANNITNLLLSFADILVFVGTILAVLAFIYVGFLFVMARGNSAKLEAARAWFFGVVVGTAILISAKVIVVVVKNTLTSAGVVNEGVFNTSSSNLGTTNNCN